MRRYEPELARHEAPYHGWTIIEVALAVGATVAAVGLMARFWFR